MRRGDSRRSGPPPGSLDDREYAVDVMSAGPCAAAACGGGRRGRLRPRGGRRRRIANAQAFVCGQEKEEGGGRGSAINFDGVLELTGWIEDGFEEVVAWWCLVMEGLQGFDDLGDWDCSLDCPPTC
jgi:hypothetical protein